VSVEKDRTGRTRDRGKQRIRGRGVWVVRSEAIWLIGVAREVDTHGEVDTCPCMLLAVPMDATRCACGCYDMCPWMVVS